MLYVQTLTTSVEKESSENNHRWFEYGGWECQYLNNLQASYRNKTLSPNMDHGYNAVLSDDKQRNSL